MWPFDQKNQPTYQQYASAYDSGNFQGIDPHQAYGHIQQFMQGAPLDMQQNIYQQHFVQMPYEQRAFLAQLIPPHYGLDPNNPAAMAQGFARFGQEQPGMLAQLLRHPFLLGSGVVLAGLIAKHMIARHEQREHEYNAIPPFGGNPYGTPWGGDPVRFEESAARHEERAEWNPNPYAAAEERREARHEMREANWDREHGR